MTTPTPARELLDVPLALLDDPAVPSRAEMDDAKLDELAASLLRIGLQQPIIAARVGERFEVIAGHRRRIAALRAGLATVPCIVYPDKTIPHYVIQAHENSRREELNPADEAVWFAELLEHACGGDVEQLAALVGESYAKVSDRLLLLAGDHDVLDALRRGDVGIGVAKELNKVPDEPMRRYFLRCAIESGASLASVSRWIVDWRLSGANSPSAAPAAAPVVAGLADPIRDPLTCEVCGRADNAHLIRHVPVHQHCKMAILDPLLGKVDKGA